MNRITALFNKITGTSKDVSDKNIKKEDKFLIKETDPLEIKFAKNFSGSEGKFFFCESKDEFNHSVSDMFKANKWVNPFCSDPSILDLIKDTDLELQVNYKESDCLCIAGFYEND